MYECRTGHVYADDALLNVQTDALDDALWGAHRALLEHAELNRRIARRMETSVGDPDAAARYRRLGAEAERRADTLHDLILAHRERPATHADLRWTTTTTPDSKP
jgi:two-component system chemotaxis response regulator CheB